MVGYHQNLMVLQTEEYCCGEIPFTECDAISYINEVANFWRTPNPIYGDSAFAMRFDNSGDDTLIYVSFSLLIYSIICANRGFLAT